MRYILILWGLSFAACSKPPLVATAKLTKQTCSFGLTESQLRQNALIQRPEVNLYSKKPPLNENRMPVILLDFDGHTVEGTGWNWDGPIICGGSGLSVEAAEEIYLKLKDAYSKWRVLVTTSETDYNDAPSNRRTRVILTTSWEWFGMAGGVAFLNSFTSNDPCFVFTSLLGYNVKYIKEASAHEAGHTLGLYHQSTWSNDDPPIFMNEYNYGGGGLAPIMGCAYYQPLSGWIIGRNNLGDMQDDEREISRLLRRI